MRFSFKFFLCWRLPLPPSLTRGTMLFWGFTSPTLRRRKGFDSVHQIFSKKDRALLLFVQAELRLFAFSGEREREWTAWRIHNSCRLSMKVSNDSLPKNTLKTYKSFFFRNAEMDIVAAGEWNEEERKREKELVSYKGSWRMNWDEKIEELGSSWKVHCIRSDKSANDLVKTWIGEARLSSGAYWLLLEELYWL